MPGLFGFLNLDGGPTDADAGTALLAEMGDRLCHAGGESVDTWTDFDRGFAIGRAGLPHLQPAPWPGRGDGGAVFIDGVLHSDSPDAEETRRRFPEQRATALGRLRGFFSAAAWSPAAADGRLVLAVDRRASHPLMWAVVDGTLYFAPEVKALLAVAGLPRDPDPAALSIFYASGFVLAGQTLFSAVRRLEGGTLLATRGDGAAPRVERYWEYRMTVDGDGSPPIERERELSRRLRRAMERNLTDPEHDVVFLSGGRDSRVILGGALAMAGEGSRVKTVSWTGGGAPPGSDVAVAQQLANTFGTDHRVIPRRLDGWAEHTVRLTYILDGLSDLGAFHGYEFEIMRQLMDGGARKVLRGDQCFSRGDRMADLEHAIRRMSVRSLSSPTGLGGLVREAAYRELTEAGDAAVAEIARRWSTTHPDNARDEIYFAHRLQGYLNQSVYFKQVLLDHRNPLLDEDLLDYIQVLPIAERHLQRVFRSAAERAFPEVWEFPFATRSNLEKVADLLAADTPVRRGVARQFADGDSRVWELFDRRAFVRRLESLGSAPRSRSVGARLKSAILSSAKSAVGRVPALDRRLRSRYLRGLTREGDVFLRLVVLKLWFDLFVEGDGSRRALEEQLERARSVS